MDEIKKFITKNQVVIRSYNSPFSLFDSKSEAFCSSQTLANACYASVPHYYRLNYDTFIVPNNNNKLTDTEVHTYISFLIGKDSPWYPFKDLLWEDTNIDFIIKYGFVFKNTQEIPCNLLINFSKAFRILGEWPQFVKKWIIFQDQGLSAKEAFYLSCCFITDGNGYRLENFTHSFLPYSYQLYDIFSIVFISGLNKKNFSKPPKDRFDFRGIDNMWERYDKFTSPCPPDFKIDYIETRSPYGKFYTVETDSLITQFRNLRKKFDVTA